QSAATTPMASVIANASAPPTKAMRSARLRSPAPTLVPTSATNGAPRPKTSGTSRYSSRADVPYPAAAAGPAAGATKALASAMLALVRSGVTAATAPTLGISRNNDQRGRVGRNRAILRPDRMYQASTAVPAA